MVNQDRTLFCHGSMVVSHIIEPMRMFLTEDAAIEETNTIQQNQCNNEPGLFRTKEKREIEQKLMNTEFSKSSFNLMHFKQICLLIFFNLRSFHVQIKVFFQAPNNPPCV